MVEKTLSHAGISHVINWLYFDVIGLRDPDCVNCCENPFAPLKVGAFFVCDILWQIPIGKASAIMGMYDTVYAELDCPFCGRQYHYCRMQCEAFLRSQCEG